jgi:hypothetical protein
MKPAAGSRQKFHDNNIRRADAIAPALFPFPSGTSPE